MVEPEKEKYEEERRAARALRKSRKKDHHGSKNSVRSRSGSDRYDAKKLKAKNSSVKGIKNPSTEGSHLLASNQFHILSDNNQNSTDNEDMESDEGFIMYATKKVKKEAKPPPISVFEVAPENVKNLMQKASNWAKGLVHFRCFRSKLNIYTYTKEDYNVLKQKIKSEKLNFFTFTHKDDKQQSYVIKGLHHSCDIADISKALTELKCKPVFVKPMTKLVKTENEMKRSPADMYHVNFDSQTEPEKFLSVKFLLNFKITWEKKHRSPATQCKRCQRYGHAASNCNMPYRCVKCNAPEHGPGLKCPKDPKDDPFCVNCEGMHPANHSRCKVRTDYISRTSRQNNNVNVPRILRSKPTISRPQQQQQKSHQNPTSFEYSSQNFPALPMSKKPPVNFVREACTFASLVTPSHTPESPSSSDSTPSNIFDFFDKEVNSIFGVDLLTLMGKFKEFHSQYKQLTETSDKKNALFQFLWKFSN